MRILFAGTIDWANAANRIARAIRAAGADARVLTLRPHPYGYDEDQIRPQEAKDFAARADWIIHTGDGDYARFQAILRHLLTSRRVRVATLHVGTAYRERFADYNVLDAELFDLRFIGGDLYRLRGHRTPHAVPFFIPADSVIGRVTPPEPDAAIRVCHASSYRKGKGTDIIEQIPGIEVMEDLSFEDCMKRRRRSHIYVDQINALGGFGAAAVEAMADGCAVVGSQANIVPEVDAFYPRPPILEVDAVTVRSVVESLRGDRALLHDTRCRSLQWAREHAAPAAAGRYWLRHLDTAPRT